MRLANRLADGFTALAILQLAASMLMPWSQERSCPLFEECGPWATQTGWEVAGGALVGFLVLVSLAYGLLWSQPLARRIGVAALFLVVGVALAVFGAWGDFAIFGDVRFPLEGYVVAWVATALGLGASVIGAALDAQEPRATPMQAT